MQANIGGSKYPIVVANRIRPCERARGMALACHSLMPRAPTMAKVLESSRHRAEVRSKIAAMDAALHCIDHLSFSQAHHGVVWIYTELEGTER